MTRDYKVQKIKSNITEWKSILDSQEIYLCANKKIKNKTQVILNYWKLYNFHLKGGSECWSKKLI